MVPTSNGRDDAIGISGPDERFCILVGLGKEALDGGLQIGQRAEHPALEPALAELGKEALDRIEPGGRCRRVMEQETRMPAEPGAHLGVLVAAVVVEDDVHDLPGGDLGLESVEKPDELLMPVALHATADDLTFEHVERGKQGRRAVALVVVGLSSRTGRASAAVRAGSGQAPEFAISRRPTAPPRAPVDRH